VFAPLLDMLRSSSPDARLASLRATHALATRAGAILRLRVGTPEFVDALWSQLLPTERPADPAPDPDADADPDPDAAVESPPSPAVARVLPPAPQVFHALRALCAAVFPDWETANHVVGAPPDAPVALARDLTPLIHLLRPGVFPHDAVREKAARLARLLARSRSGRDALCREPDAGGGLLETLAEAARSSAPEDAKLRVIAARLVTALARDDVDAAAAAARLADSGATRALFETLLAGGTPSDANEAATEAATETTTEAATEAATGAATEAATDDAVREAAALALARLAATSETAARSFVSWGALDTIAATLPAPDRFETPPPTPPPDEEDNVFADAYAGRGEGFVDDVSDARRAPAIPSMTGDVAPPSPPPPRKARTPGLTAALFDLLAALTRHDAIREEACARGGLAEARGLLPGGGHRPTWTGVALHSAIPAAKEEREERETSGGDDAKDEGADVQEGEADGDTAPGDSGASGDEGAAGDGDGDAVPGDAAPGDPGDAAPGDGDASPGSPGSPGSSSTDWRSLRDRLATSARLIVAPAGGDASSVPALVRGDPPVDDASSCAAALRALETLARDARCRDELLADGGAGAKTLAAIVRRGARGCVEPALRTLLLVVSAAEDEKTLAKTLASAASAASAASGGGAAAALELKRRAETTSRAKTAEEGDGAAIATAFAKDARDRDPDPDEFAYDVLTCDVVRSSVAGVPLEGASASLRGAVATAMTSYPLSAVLPPARPPAPEPPVKIEPPKAPLGRAHVRAPVRRAAAATAAAVEDGAVEKKEKEEKGEEGGEEEAGETLEIVTER
jgi:hypothetical protein